MNVQRKLYLVIQKIKNQIVLIAMKIVKIVKLHPKIKLYVMIVL